MTRADDLPIRPALVGGGAYGAPQLDVPVCLNANENPHAPSAKVIEAIKQAVGEVAGGLQRYPDRDALLLRQDLAAYLESISGVDVCAAQVWAANGSNEVLQQLIQVFGGPGRSAMGFEPSYSMHQLISRGFDTRFVSVSRSSDFGIDVQRARKAIASERPDVVFLCSPNNPTGTAVELAVIAELYDEIALGDNGVLIVDEAYGEFSHRPSAITLLSARPRLIVTRTMSKAFAFAGARVGYLVADPAVVEAVLRVRLPYHLSALTQAAARAALANADELMAAVADLKVQRDRIVTHSRELGLKVAESDANFVLIGGFSDQQVIWEQLLQRGVLVRDVGLAGWLRVTAGTQAETTAFIVALADVMSEQDRVLRSESEQERA